MLTFARLTEEAKRNRAIKFLEKANKRGILPLSDETFEILQQKHPEASEASGDMLLKDTSQDVHVVIYKSINSETRGAASPSEMDLTYDAVYWFQVTLGM